MINTKTRQLYNDICSLIRNSEVPPINVELMLELLLRDISLATEDAIKKEQEQIANDN